MYNKNVNTTSCVTFEARDKKYLRAKFKDIMICIGIVKHPIRHASAFPTMLPIHSRWNNPTCSCLVREHACTYFGSYV